MTDVCCYEMNDTECTVAEKPPRQREHCGEVGVARKVLATYVSLLKFTGALSSSQAAALQQLKWPRASRLVVRERVVRQGGCSALQPKVIQTKETAKGLQAPMLTHVSLGSRRRARRATQSLYKPGQDRIDIIDRNFGLSPLHACSALSSCMRP